MSTEEITSVSPTTWYFPHHLVFNPINPDKTIVVLAKNRIR